MVNRLRPIDDDESQFALGTNPFDDAIDRKLNAEIVNQRQKEPITVLLGEDSCKLIDEISVAKSSLENPASHLCCRRRAGRG